MAKITQLIFLFLLLISVVNAVVISPIEKEIKYEPDKEESCGFNIKSSMDAKISISVSGDLNSSVKLEKNSFFAEKDKWYTADCIIKIPADLKPGKHEVNILSLEGDLGGSGVSAIGGVIFPIKLFVPYPEKYIEILNFDIKNIKVNDNVEFRIYVASRSTQKLENVNAKIKIISSEKVFSELETNSISLVTDEKNTLSVNWSANVEPGNYLAKAIIYFDGKETEVQDDFRIGDISINIKEINHNKIKTNNIAKFNIMLESLWNSAIENVYIVATISDKNKNIAEIKSENFNIESWAKTEKQLFWDTKDIMPGSYSANFSIYHSEGKSSEKQIKFEVHKNYFQITPETLILILVVIILLVILIYNIKKSKKK